MRATDVMIAGKVSRSPAGPMIRVKYRAFGPFPVRIGSVFDLSTVL